MTEEFNSTDDTRATNSPVGHKYRKLSDYEKAQVADVKDAGEALIRICHELGHTDPDGEKLGSRDLSLAVTHIEDAVMRMVRHLTR